MGDGHLSIILNGKEQIDDKKRFVRPTNMEYESIWAGQYSKCLVLDCSTLLVGRGAREFRAAGHAPPHDPARVAHERRAAHFRQDARHRTHTYLRMVAVQGVSV